VNADLLRLRATEILVERRHRRRSQALAFASVALGFAAGLLIDAEHAPLAIVCAVGAGLAFKLAR
jgi:hypothetical protein